ncbi:MAG: LVIVD repeat-containing protein [Actinomycetota bacterium]
MKTRPRRKHARLAGIILAVAILAGFSPGSAKEAWEPHPMGWISGPLEHVGLVPVDGGGAVGATIHEDLLYVSSWRSFSIYDISDPALPLPLSTVPLGPHLYNEQPDTNGEIAILTQDVPRSELQIWDVSDPTLPEKIATLPSGRSDHMWTCVLNCRYVYGGRGTIVDLKDPTSPEVVGDWSTSARPNAYHAIEEVAPGIILTGSSPVFMLDARKDPTNPRVGFSFMPKADDNPSAIQNFNGPAPAAYLDWPQAKDRILLSATESPFNVDCSEETGAFTTYDTKGWRQHRTPRYVEEYRLDPSEEPTYTNGRAPYNVVGCSPYTFATPPSYRKSRLVTVPWFEQGMRLLQVSKRGGIEELGGFIPTGGSSSSAIWVDNEIFYLIDLVRGLDVMRVTSED